MDSSFNFTNFFQSFDEAIRFSPSTSLQDFMDLDDASPAYDSSVLNDGGQTSISASGSSSIGDLHFGIRQEDNRVTSHTPTPETGEVFGRLDTPVVQSISARPLFETTSHEELRWSYYQPGNQGVKTSRKASGRSSIGDLHFGTQQRDNRVAVHTPTHEAGEYFRRLATPVIQSISAWPLFATTSHEELRWSYYQYKYQAIPNPPRQQLASFWRQSDKPREEASQQSEAPKDPTFSCPICMEKMDEIYSTMCGHVFCRPCIKASIRTQKKCPTCRKELSEGKFHRVFLP